ncbi:MAG: hypothetical protein Q6364_05335 [Candidatus Hermodarchaeota archaeon]|nr:hypothetical protein [Candidatus Hermodarchaeota archaeon]
MALDRKNLERLTEGYTIIIGIGVIITIAGLIAFSILLLLTIPWFSISLIFVFLGMWIAASQWNELGKGRIVAGFVASITRPTRITTAANLLNMKRYDFIHSLSKIITRAVVEVEIYPEVDAFGPKGVKRPKSAPKDYQPSPVTTLNPYQRLTTILQWIGLVGTIIAIIYHILGLLRYLGVF